MRSAACWDSGGDDDPRISGDHVRTVIQEQEDGRGHHPKIFIIHPPAILAIIIHPHNYPRIGGSEVTYKAD